jgi:hypothetical protein
MSSLQDVHDELAAVFQFPSYYGRNYNAAVDCLRDLDWCEVKHRSFLVVVTDADRLIQDVPTRTIEDPLTYLLDVAVRIGAEMAEEYQWADDFIRPPTSFKFLFQASDTASFTRLREAVSLYAKKPVTLDLYHGTGAVNGYGLLP